ncbi:hypothetical protein ATEIFO6365_0003091900 [Aspergillus terreus]|uniref:Uncharacterized protein n=1 Tax=Aspergillus terreus TaxID=33178 RepID=A0A5M3YSZ6_ASPTE|nr:hypothetical protein ATETN484_0003086500 [Aspergillus terreus]GFF14851.1 hypothetical protein ATEIFO6365_0003091900 [Aspergillus terreus]
MLSLEPRYGPSEEEIFSEETRETPLGRFTATSVVCARGTERGQAGENVGCEESKTAGQVEVVVSSEGIDQIAQGRINEPFILIFVGRCAADRLGRMAMASRWVLDIVL